MHTKLLQNVSKRGLQKRKRGLILEKERTFSRDTKYNIDIIWFIRENIINDIFKITYKNSINSHGMEYEGIV